MRRLLVDIMLVLGVFLVPWWIVLACAILAQLYFPHFYEILFLGLIIDSLYTSSDTGFFGIHFVATCIAIAVFLIAEILRKSLRVYSR